MPAYDEEMDADRLQGMLREELAAGEENLDAVQYLTERSRRDARVLLLIQGLFLTLLGVLISSLISTGSRFIAPVFEPFVLPVCVVICFVMYNVHLEYQRLSTEAHQLAFFFRRLKRALSRVQDELGMMEMRSSMGD